MPQKPPIAKDSNDLDWDEPQSELNGGKNLSPHDYAVIAQFLKEFAEELNASQLILDGKTLETVAETVAQGKGLSSIRRKWSTAQWLSSVKLNKTETGLFACFLGRKTFVLTEVGLKHNLLVGTSWKEITDLLKSADTRTIRKFVEISSAIQPGREKDNIRFSWDYVMACLGYQPAMRSLAELLIVVSSDESYRLSEEIRANLSGISSGWLRLSDAWKGASIETLDQPVQLWARREAANIIAQNGFSLLLIEQEALKLEINLPVSKLSPVKPEIKEDAEEPELISNARTALKVLDSIGDPNSDEGPNIKLRFSNLLKSLPLLGGQLDPDHVYRNLQREFPWMDQANQEIATSIAFSHKVKLGHFRTSPILLVGPPGVGKTRYARRLAAITNLGFGYLSVAGAHSAMSINGNERGWKGGTPSFPAHKISGLAIANPVLLIDEIDKAGASQVNGDAVNALLPMLEVETSQRYFDTFLLGNLNLSHITWILTANRMDTLIDPLLSRCTVVHTGSPSAKDFQNLVKSILEDIALTYQTNPSNLPDISMFYPRLEYAFLEAGPSVRRLKTAIIQEIKQQIWTPPKPKLVGGSQFNSINI